MTTRPMLKGAVIGLASGNAGMKAMDIATTKMAEYASQADKEQEKRVSPSVAYNLAARDLAAKAGVAIDEDEAASAGNVLHLGLGLSAGLLYTALRQGAGWSSPLAALASSGALFLGVDEGLNWAMGWSAPPSEYPLSTHLRGAAGHLVLGVVIAITSEGLTWALA